MKCIKCQLGGVANTANKFTPGNPKQPRFYCNKNQSPYLLPESTWNLLINDQAHGPHKSEFRGDFWLEPQYGGIFHQ